MFIHIIFFLLLPLTLIAENADNYLDSANSDALGSVIADIHTEPSSIVGGCVNVITGDYVEFDVDLTIPGPEPFQVQRSYASNDFGEGLLFSSWRSGHHSKIALDFNRQTRHQTIKASYLGGCGERMHYEVYGYRDDATATLKPLKKMYQKGMTNTSKGAISGQTHPKNNRLIHENKKHTTCWLYLGSGEKHRFRRYGDDYLYLLREISKPTGMRFHYSYAKDQLSSVELFNRAGQELVRATYHEDVEKVREKKTHTLEVRAPDGRKVHYRFQNFSKKRDYYILTDVKRSDGPPVHYVVDEAYYKEGNNGGWSGNMERIKRKELPESRFVEVDYYKKGDNYVLGKNFKIDDYGSKRLNRVREIFMPLGKDGTRISYYKFVYNLLSGPGQIKTTVVYDAYNRKAEYNFNQEDRLSQIVQYDDQGLAYSIDSLLWGPAGTSQQINLQWRVFGRYHAAEKEFARFYEYDGKGNIVKDTLFGIITGANLQPLLINQYGGVANCGVESKTRTYQYNDLNCVTLMKEGEITVEYRYVAGTSLLEATFQRDRQGIFRRTFLHYDHNAQVIEEITDDGATYDKKCLDGVTERFITKTKRSAQYPFGLPIQEIKSCIDVKTGTELPIHTKKQTFDRQGRLIKLEMYGSDGVFTHAQQWKYDAYGNLTEMIDPLGRVIRKQYDANGNCIQELGPLPGLNKAMQYDCMNRLTAFHEHHSDGLTLSQYFQYDFRGNKVSSTDAFGHTTRYQYDSFGRLMAEESFSGVIHYEHNALSQVTKVTDAMGHATQKRYTIFGKPYEVIHPDGTIERIKYNLQSEVVETLSPTGVTVKFVRDGRGRILKTESYTAEGELYAVSENRYDQTHLLEEIDPLGHITFYHYDACGRLSSICKEDSLVEYSYDALGRRIATAHMNPDRTEGTITRHTLDALGQVIEEQVEDISGALFTHSTFQYDELGRKIASQVGDALSQYKFDTHGMLMESIDPEGAITTCNADYHYVNASGQRVLKTFQINPRGIQTITCYDVRGQKSTVEILDPFGSSLFKEEMIYDLNGNLLQKTASPEPHRVYRFVYDSMNRLVESYQAYGTADQKMHSIQYDSHGFKNASVKPDGVVLSFVHDCFGRVTSIQSSDGTVDDCYSYDVKNNPIEVVNNVTGARSLRNFNSEGKLLQETHQNGLTTSYTYAYDGSIKTFTLPDSSQVTYQYQAGFLKEAKRLDAQGNLQYAHRILAYDGQGNIIREELPQDLGEIIRRFNRNGNLLASNSLFFGEVCAAYDPIGNLMSRNVLDPVGTYHEAYEYDFLNQLTKEAGHFHHTFSHDAHHNRLSQDGIEYTSNQLNQILSEGTTKLTYDLNGNLLTYGNISCQYDALDRLTRVEKEGKIATYSYDEMHRCMQRNEERYFYLSQAEAGACSSNGMITAFQMVGPGRSSAPCQALTIELNGKPYAAFHDQSGHLRTLVSHKTRKPTTYRYSAFGEKAVFNPIANPWTFAGKREDPLTSWILFGRRFYLPTLGRFLTQDPAGLTASPNLYAYLSNSPLVRYDTYGLFESASFFSSISHTAWRVASTAAHILSTPFKAANLTRKFAGDALYHIGRHVVPLPGFQDIPQAAGYFLKNSSLDGYVPSHREKLFDVVKGTAQKLSGAIGTEWLGIGVDDQSAIASQQQAEKMNGFHTETAYGPTHGFMRDLLECGFEKLGIKTRLVKAFTKYNEQLLENSGEDVMIKLDCHSRGGITFSNVFPHLTDQQKSQYWVNTHGTATIIGKEGFAYMMNNISDREFVTPLADPFGYGMALFKQQEHVTFHRSNAAFLEHGIMSDTYRESFKKGVERFYERNFGVQ